MQMMYETIYKALVEVGLEGSYEPQDFLNFFCLGNREAQGSAQGNSHAANTPQVHLLLSFLLSFDILSCFQLLSLFDIHF